jgi:hypothetical protein
LRFLTINITITHLIVCSIFGSFELNFNVHEQIFLSKDTSKIKTKDIHPKHY